jgi:hypothetical protein
LWSPNFRKTLRKLLLVAINAGCQCVSTLAIQVIFNPIS